MSQMILPIFPVGATYITSSLVFENRDNHITYFHGSLPIFSHAKDDVSSFRMIISQFYINGHAKQADIARAFGVTAIFVKRSVKIYKEHGIKGFYAPKKTRGTAVLTSLILEEIQRELNEGKSISAISSKLDLKADTIRKAVLDGRLQQIKKKHLRK
jgi:transposase-like protein